MTAIVPARWACPSGEPAGDPADQRRRVAGDHGVVAESRDRARTPRARSGRRPASTGSAPGAAARRTGPPPAAAAARPARPVVDSVQMARYGSQVLGADLAPAGAPGAQRHAHLGQLRAALGEPVAGRPVARRACHHAVALQPAQPGGQHAARQTRRAGQDLAEPLAADHQVAQDDRRPALGEHLRTQRDRAELAVSLHSPERSSGGAGRRKSSLRTSCPVARGATPGRHEHTGGVLGASASTTGSPS